MSHATLWYDHPLQHIFQPWRKGRRDQPSSAAGSVGRRISIAHLLPGGHGVFSLLCVSNAHLRGQRPWQMLLATYPVSAFAVFLSNRIPILFTKCPLPLAHSDAPVAGSDRVDSCWPVGSSWKSAGDFWDSLWGCPFFPSFLHLPARDAEFSGR